MKFPSVKYLAQQAMTTAMRFTLPLVIAFTGSFVSMQLVHDSNVPSLLRLLFTCLLGLPLSLGCALFAERSGRPAMKHSMRILTVALCWAYWQWLSPTHIFEDRRLSLVFAVLLVVVHLWVALAAYLKHNERTGFWRFNETLYVRMIIGALFSAALYAGLALALEACHVLLKFDIASDTYLKLWIVVAGIFNTWFFLAGVPGDYAEINTEHTFPKALKIFTQYILIPLVTLYMVILYAYGFKIIGMWSLPKGWVSELILCYSIVGILAVLLVNPLRDNADNGWVRLFSKFFFIASLPLIVLLYTGIYTRVSHYGITESRYYLILLGAWLGYISLYFIFSRQKNIRVVPLSLAVIGILSLFGPWSAFAVSERSQLSRLENILIKNNIWKPGEKVTHSGKQISNNYDAEQVRNVLEYFATRDEVAVLQPIYAADLNALVAYADKKNTQKDYRWERYDILKDTLTHILCTNQINGMTRYRNDLVFSADHRLGINAAGYSRIFNLSFATYNQEKQWIFLTATDSTEVTLTEKDGSTSLNFVHNSTIIQTINLDGLVKVLKAKEQQGVVPQPEMTIDCSGLFSPRIIIRSVSIRDPESTENEDKIVRDLDIWVLIK